MAKESGADLHNSVHARTAVGFAAVMTREPESVVKKSDALMEAAYEKMHEALIETGRPIVFGMCQYGYANMWEWGPRVGGNL